MLRGEKVKIRAIEENDLSKIVEWRNSPEIYDLFFGFEPFSEIKQKIWFEKQLNDHSQKNFIISTMENEPIGMVSLYCIDWRNRKAEFGRFLIGEKKYLHQGYGEETLSLILEYGFKHLNLNRLYLETFSTNKRAISLYKKFGFQEEGRLRKHIFKNGKYQDVVILGLLKEDYIKGK